MAKQITARQAFAAGVTASHYDMTKVRHACGCWRTYRRYITLNVVAEMEKGACPKCANTVIASNPQSHAPEELAVTATDLHTDDCNARRTRRQLERDAWEAQYPHFCRDCNATGGHMTGSSLYDPPEFIHCPTCLAQGKCPRCGASGVDPDAVLYGLHPVCVACGWNSPEEDHAPYVPKCYCGLTGELPDDPLGPLEDYPF